MPAGEDKKPHPLALFTLIARNHEAKNVILAPENAHLISVVKDKENFRHPGLDVGFNFRSKWQSATTTTLATIGRGHGADIYISNTHISKIQCYFDFNPDTGIVMIHDVSNSMGPTMKFIGQNAKSFEPNRRPWQVAVTPSVNTELAMGGPNRDSYLFELIWHHTSKAEQYGKLHGSVYNILDPRAADTLYLASIVDVTMVSDFISSRAAVTAQQTRVTSRLHTVPSSPNTGKIRFDVINGLGSGTFGAVTKAVDVDTGRLIAIKKIRIKKNGNAPARNDVWVAEVNSLSNLVHVSASSLHSHRGGLSLTLKIATHY